MNSISTKKKTFQKVIILSDSEDESMKPLKGLNKKKTLTKCYQKPQDLEISDEDDRFDDFLQQYRPTSKTEPFKSKPIENIDQRKGNNSSIILISDDDHDDDLLKLKKTNGAKSNKENKKKISNDLVFNELSSSSSLESLKGFNSLKIYSKTIIQEINCSSGNLATNQLIKTKTFTNSLTESTEQFEKVGYLTFIESLSQKVINEAMRDPLALTYLNNFKTKECKEDLMKKCFLIFNESVFANKLPSDMSLVWNPKLTSSGGYCKKIIQNKKQCTEIHISIKVCDTPERLRDTLIHELCHAASFIIDGLLKDGHGPAWQRWASVSNSKYKTIPLITRCHSYKTEKKFIYRCENCKYEFHRNRRSIDINKFSCGSCKNGRFFIVENEKLQKNSSKKS